MNEEEWRPEVQQCMQVLKDLGFAKISFRMHFAADEEGGEFEDYALSKSSIPDSFGEVEKVLKQIQVIRDNGKTGSVYDVLLEQAFDMAEVETQSIDDDCGAYVEFLPIEGQINCDAYAHEYEDEDENEFDEEGDENNPAFVP